MGKNGRKDGRDMDIGTVLSYGAAGVCRITDIRHEKILGEEVEYYVLVPHSDRRTTIYVPTNNEQLVGKMQKLLSVDEVHALINSMPDTVGEWIPDERMRNEEYKRIMDSGSHSELVRTMKAIYTREKELASEGKKLRSLDSTHLKLAEEKLYNEIAHVLGIGFDEVANYIENRISERIENDNIA